MAEIRWSDVAADFEPDGTSSLREIVVPDVALAEWQALLDLIHEASWPARYRQDGSHAPLPARVEDILASVSRDRSAALMIEADGLEADVWFFDQARIHCSVGTADIASQEALDRLLSFMRALGRCCGRAVYLTYEGGEEHPHRNAFLVYRPADDYFSQFETPRFGEGPVFGNPSHVILLDDTDAVRVLLMQQAAWEDSPLQLDEIDARLDSVVTYVLSDQLEPDHAQSATKPWRIEIRCMTPLPLATSELFDRARASIRKRGGDLLVKPPDSDAGFFD